MLSVFPASNDARKESVGGSAGGPRGWGLWEEMQEGHVGGVCGSRAMWVGFVAGGPRGWGCH